MASAEWLSDIYSTVDDACACEGALPPGAIGRLSRLVDAARMIPADRTFIKRADDMLLVMHHLRSSLTRRASRADVAEIRMELRSMRDEWIRTAPIW